MQERKYPFFDNAQSINLITGHYAWVVQVLSPGERQVEGNKH